MPITAADLVVYQTANHPKDDTGASGGAISTTGRVKDMPMASSTAPKAASDNAGDTMNLTLEGRDDAGVYQTETIALTGTTQITFTTTFKQLLRVVLASAAAGTVTVYMNDGTTVIVTLEAGIVRNHAFFVESSSDATPQTRYEKLHPKNNHGTLTLQSPQVFLRNDLQSRLEIGEEAAADQNLTNRLTVPSPAVTFVDDDVAINLSDVVAGGSVGIFVKQALLADDPAFTSTFEIEFKGTTAA